MARSCAAAILGGDPGDAQWLDSDACADAVAYTPHERLPMLLGIDVLVRRPPFTNQLTHVDDEARMARDLDFYSGMVRSPTAVAHAEAVTKAALSRDPGNPALSGILEGIDLNLGDMKGALALSVQVEEMLPRDYATAADRATILMMLGRYDEAGKILSQASGSGADLDNLAPALCDYWSRTKRFDEGRQFLKAAIAGRPGDRLLPYERANLLIQSGDSSGAEREYRAILAADPASTPALEGLVGILLRSGRADAADQVSVAAAASQPGNQENSLRAVKACDAKGDVEGSVRNLEAAELSGPVSATFELTLALDLYKLRRMDDMMVRLAEARRMASIYEHNDAVTDSIDKLIARMRLEMASPP
jgi:predicted Zn-dependent protease